MAFTDNVHCVSLISGADLRAAQYHFVTFTATDLELTGDGLMADGIVMNDPNDGEVAEVAIGGIAKVECAGDITKGADVASGTGGEAVVASTGDVILGRAIEAGSDGAIISILFQPRGAFA